MQMNVVSEVHETYLYRAKRQFLRYTVICSTANDQVVPFLSKMTGK